MAKLPRIGFSGSSFRAQEGSALTTDQIERFAPSVLAVDKHESRSERYSFLSTHDIVEHLRTMGFYPVFVSQGGSRVEGKKEYTKHCVRLRHDSLRHANGTHIEILIYNSHDGTSSWNIWIGGFVYLCLNGIVFGAEMFSARISHSKRNAAEMVGEACGNALGAANVANESIEAMRATILLPEETKILAAEAIDMRFADTIARVGHAPVSVDQMLQTRRYEEREPNLYNTFNVLQEHAVRGGMHYTTRDANMRRRHGTTREVTGIDGNRTLNQRLWNMAEKFGQLKRGEISVETYQQSLAG